MWEVGGALGRQFFLSGFLPAFLFLTAVNIMLARHGNSLWELSNLESLVVDATVILLASTLLGLLLLVLNTPIIKLYENGIIISRWLKRGNIRRHEQLYPALLARRAAYLKAAEQGAQTEDAIAKLEAVHEKIEQTTHGVRNLPIEVQNVMPTALGNAFAVMEEYAYERYGMDAMVYWPRLVMVLPEAQRSQIADLKTTIDFLLNLSLVAILFALVAIPVGISRLSVVEPVTGLLAIFASYALYRMAVGTTMEMGEAVMSSFDLCRRTLLKEFGLPEPTSLLAERKVWLLLTSFIRRGEDFYFPITLDIDDNHALLQQELNRHIHNLYLLKQQAALFAAGETPLHLLNQLEAETQKVQEIRAAVVPH